MDRPIVLTKRRRAEKAVALAIFDALKGHEGKYVSGKPGIKELTSIDGEFYLMLVARKVINRMNQESFLQLNE